MKIDEIKIQMLNYDCNDIKCLICGENSKDSKSWEIIHESYSVRYECDCGMFSVYYGFHKTTNTKADYDTSRPQCPECGSPNFVSIEELISRGDLEMELGCCECECRWMEFYKFHGVIVIIDDGMLSSNPNGDIIFVPLERE